MAAMAPPGSMEPREVADLRGDARQHEVERLRGAGNREALERALEATGSARLEVSWRS